jgi:hypothetical protein
VGRYPVFSHEHDEEDTGIPEYSENYDGKVNGDDYCVDCYPDVLSELEEEG